MTVEDLKATGVLARALTKPSWHRCPNRSVAAQRLSPPPAGQRFPDPASWGQGLHPPHLALGPAVGHDPCGEACLSVPSPQECGNHRAHLRLRSLSWALLAGGVSGLLGLLLPWPQDFLERLDPALRAAGCGFFYGLLAFHLQRVDPDDGHLQAGLVGAICAIRSLAAPFPWTQALPPGDLHAGPFTLEELTGVLSSLMMEALLIWLPLWWPVVGSALLLQWAQRLLPAPRP